MNKRLIYNQVINRIEELVKICKRKKWDIIQKPVIEPPASIQQINKIEYLIGQQIPDDLKELFQFSRHVEFGYQFDETLSEEFNENFSGDIYWNLEMLPELVEDFKGWIEGALDPLYNDIEPIETTRKNWKNKLPFINVPNGDVITIGTEPSEIMYFSHEGDVMHCKKLGNNLWSFLDFHSRIGFAGSEDWQFEPFFDFEKDEMKTSGDKVERFIKLLNE